MIIRFRILNSAFRIGKHTGFRKVTFSCLGINESLYPAKSGLPLCNCSAKGRIT